MWTRISDDRPEWVREEEKKNKKNIIALKFGTKRASRKKQKEMMMKKKKNQKNFNSFIHSINIILDMVFLYTLYIFKGTYTRLIDCGVKKVCEGLWHRMAYTSLSVRCIFSEWIDCTHRTNGNRKKAITTRRRIRRKLQLEINSLSVRIFVKSEQKREKKLYIQTYQCVYISFSAWALNVQRCYCRHPKSEPRKKYPPPPHHHALARFHFFLSLTHSFSFSLTPLASTSFVVLALALLYVILALRRERYHKKSEWNDEIERTFQRALIRSTKYV